MLKQVRILKGGITFNGLDAKVGEVKELDPKAAKSLVESKLAEYVEVEEVEEEETFDPKGKAGKPVGEEIEAIAKAIDDKHKRDDLYEEAKRLDIEVAHDTKKADLIAKIIENGKYDHLV